MAGKIKQLMDSLKLFNVFPTTLAKAVKDEDGISIDQFIPRLEDEFDDDLTEIPRVADKLGNYTEEDVTRINTELSNVNGNLAQTTEKINKSSFENYVDVKGYTSSDYVFPDDGYLWIASADNGSVTLTVTSANNSASFNIASKNGVGTDTLYVKKGMKCKCISTGGTSYARFYKLV